MSLISVIIPAYNAERTLGEAIASVMQQTHPNWELIVVDDGSTDNSRQVVHGFQDDRIRLLTGANRGVAIARNRGIEQAQGDYLAFLDADDIWMPDKLAAQLAALQTQPEAALAYSWCDYIDNAGRWLCPGKRSIVQDDAYEQLLIANFLENASTPLIRRSALAAVGGFDPTLRCSQDRDLYLRLAARYPFVTVPQVQVHYRMSEGAMSSRLREQEADRLKVIERGFAAAPLELQPLRRQSLAHLYRYLMLRGVEEPLTPQRSKEVAKCLWLAIRYEPLLLIKQSRLLLTVCIKIGAGWLPSPTANWILAFSRRYRASQ
ncbi:MAG: glycosyltransferase family 2 protein [Leptolyngbyaceae cyanobacterium]